MPEWSRTMLTFTRADPSRFGSTMGTLAVHVTDILGVATGHYDNVYRVQHAALVMRGGDTIPLHGKWEEIIEQVDCAKTQWAESHQKKE